MCWSKTLFDQGVSMTNKTLLLIDGPNLYATTKTLGFDVDFKKVLQEFRKREPSFLRANYYTALADDETTTPLVPLIDWLDYNGYSVITKPVKTFTDADGRRKTKGNMDIEIAVDAMEMAPHLDHIVLFSGDGDFRSLVEALQRRGVRVTVVSSIATQPNVCRRASPTSRYLYRTCGVAIADFTGTYFSAAP
jgi:uncharacterized LabA/DUF88 family protein